MNILLKLFLEFLKIGAFSFGGGYGMIAVMRETCLSNSWLAEDELMNFIAVAESTPGPIAINMATFIGASQAGIIGSLIATLGVVLPSFLIILLISAAFANLLKLAGVQAALRGVRPVVIGLIVATGLTMSWGVIVLTNADTQKASVDWWALCLLAVIAVIAELWKKIKKKSISPIVLILISAVAGVVLYK